jgi:Domain of unknown function DUF29
MAAQPERLCDEDFHTWTRDQARALRRLAATRPNIALDFEHLIEEVADLGKSERFAVRGQLRRIIEHSLKLAWSLASEPRPGWHETIIDARTTLDDKLSPTLPRDLRRNLNQLYVQERRNAEGALRAHHEHEAAEALPLECLFQFAGLLRHGWYPGTA